MAEPLRIDHTNAECSRRPRERQRAGRISLMIEADEVALVLMLIEQNLLPENLQDDKCAITKKRFFQIGGGCKNVFVARSKDRRGRLTSIWQLIRAGGDPNANVFAEGGAKNALAMQVENPPTLPSSGSSLRLDARVSRRCSMSSPIQLTSGSCDSACVSRSTWGSAVQAQGADSGVRSDDRGHRSQETSKRLDAIPGVGPVLATALVASIADPKAFRSGRNFSAWIGLVPKQHSSGGKDRLGSISKQGDRYLRSLFVALRFVATSISVHPF
jgi:Transposase IS116/IS110/IS902 family